MNGSAGTSWNPIGSPFALSLSKDRRRNTVLRALAKTRIATRLGMARPLTWTALLATATLMAVSTACYDNDTGRTEIGGAINFKLPVFPETGSNAVQIFTEMHYQPSYRAQEGPRLHPPADSVPIVGKELRYYSLDEYSGLTIPGAASRDYDQSQAQYLYAINCQVCHGSTLRGNGVILSLWPQTEDGTLKGPIPADLTSDITKSSTDGDLFAFITLGGRQGAAARIRDRRSTSSMPQFGLLLTEDERWTLVQFLRDQIGP
jgi:hypothetical protein